MNAHTHAHGAHDHHDHGHGHHHHDHGAHHDHHHHPHAGTLPGRADVLLTARDIHFARAGRTILEGIDLDLAPGEIVTLIGPNGAGKTTLVRILLGLERPDRGTITRRPGLSVGYAPQRFDRDPAIPMTVARFLALGSRHTPAEAETALQEVGAARVIGQQLSQLSGGELQRVVLARALLRRPNLLVLDEPVRGVDYTGEAELYDLIGRIRDARGVGILLVSHDLHVVMAQSDRVICVNRHICCSGQPEAVAQHPEYVRLFGAEAARSFAVYQHQHDHSHDLTGAALPAKEDGGER
ncbi:metal ABC transporter ATP-binding protein [Hyphomicrobium sp. CS1BSMeth3]|uniref:ATP-binding cassette domain-containing protein n=1 Tax=Hyphomicrobium sp. CS1BSMeth3 TaxID=1892844 RepID=UPI0009FB0F11|nr:metal ABC transporter ATP-binding protein [Hyphomicrobium sp. CS1BSMeth3]